MSKSLDDILREAEAELEKAKARSKDSEQVDKTAEALSAELAKTNEASVNLAENIVKLTELMKEANEGFLTPEKMDEELKKQLDERLSKLEPEKAASPRLVKWEEPDSENTMGGRVTAKHKVAKFDLSSANVIRIKDATTGSNAADIDGAPVDAMTLYNLLLEANPFRSRVTVENVATSFKLPSIANVEAKDEDDLEPDHQATGTAISSVTHNVANKVAELTVSKFSMNSFPNLQNLIQTTMLPQAIGNAEARATVTALKSIVAGRKVTTGVALFLSTSLRTVFGGRPEARA